MEHKKTFIEKVKSAGPAAVVTSAFVGPGTITSTTTSGVQFGYALLWAVVFSGISLIIIMNMASRIAIIGRKNIIDASVDLLPGKQVWKVFIRSLIVLVISLTAFGFESGNLIGATSGFADIFKLPTGLSALVMGLVSALAIIFSTPGFIETIMKVFVVSMGLIFGITGIIVRPNLGEILKGFLPTIPSGALVNTVALIGTTFIGINLVFHSVSSADKWDREEDLEDSYFDTNFNVIMGLIMTMALIITTSAVLFQSGIVVDSPVVFSKSLEPVLGRWARIFGDLGLIFAGLSSAIATPYMSGVIFGKIFKWQEKNEFRIKLSALIIVIVGSLFAAFGARPTQIVLFAQATGGFFLPSITILFVLAANSKSLGKYRNNTLQNILGMISVIVTFGLGMWTLYNIFV